MPWISGPCRTAPECSAGSRAATKPSRHTSSRATSAAEVGTSHGKVAARVRYRGPVDPIEALYRVAYLQDRGLLPTQKTAAFLRAAEVLAELPDGELDHRIRTNTLTALPRIGPSTAEVIRQAAAGKVPTRISRLEQETKISVGEGAELRAMIKGDCHTHSLWSDGGASIERMARAAIALGHHYL